VNKLNDLIERISYAADNPDEFRAAFENAVEKRVLKRHAEREEKRKELEESIRVYLLDGNHIRLRKDGEIWIAEHFNLGISAQGNSIVKALKAIYHSSVRYASALFQLGPEALAKDRLHHYDFIAAYGSATKWEQRFQTALSAKLDELSKSHIPEMNGDESVPMRVKSLCEEFQNWIRTPELVFNTETFDVDSLREFYNKNLIPLNLAQVHVTVLPDNDGVILHFIDELNGLDVTIYRLSQAAQEGENERSITRKIQGNDIRFALSALGLKIYNLDQVAFRVKIGDRYVEGRL
jgi:hypothetical protein